MSPRTMLFTTVTLLTLVVDQATKAWVVTNIAVGRGQLSVIEGLVSLVNRQNSGAAFGTLTALPFRQVLFGAFTLVAFAVLVDVVRNLPLDNRGMAATCGLLFGGAAGNALDRVRQGYVTDFLSLHVGFEPLHTWLDQAVGITELPSFNVADAAIVAGMVLFVVFFVRLPDDASDSTAEAS